jgi:hypothetical protein
MNHITYLIGAGASAHAVPVVSRLAKSFTKLIRHLSELKEEVGLSSEQITVLVDLIEACQWVQGEANKHASIDTFAKKLFIRGKNEELKRLKLVMWVLFAFFQTKNPVDFRYDSFFASIIKDWQLILPKSIKIVSWNYDQQFELAFQAFSGLDGLYVNQDKLNILAKNYSDNKVKDEFSIYKINGTASFILKNPNSTSYFDLIGKNIEKANNIVSMIDSIKSSNAVASLSFAWELGFESHLDQIIKNVAKTETLVVIGYSFPFFNRDTDRKIIKNMKSLTKVYFQSPEAGVIKERFLAIRGEFPDKHLICRSDVNQFLIPDEFEYS